MIKDRQCNGEMIKGRQCNGQMIKDNAMVNDKADNAMEK